VRDRLYIHGHVILIGKDFTYYDDNVVFRRSVSDGNNNVLLIASTSLWQLSCLPPLEEKLRDFYLLQQPCIYKKMMCLVSPSILLMRGLREGQTVHTWACDIDWEGLYLL
jgi:hypothetical protein